MSSDPSPDDRLLRWTEWGVVIVALLVAVALWDAHGVAWDDYVRRVHGDLILSYFATFGADRTVNGYGDLRLYTALPDLIAAIGTRLAPERPYAVRHFVASLFAVATLPALFRFARLLGRPWAGPAGALALIAMPVFFGHAFLNTKDIPLACAFAWAMVGLAWLFEGNRFTWDRVGVAGLAFGFPLAVRPGIWPFLVLVLAGAVVWSDIFAKPDRPPDPTERRSVGKLVGLLAVSWVVMVAVWPWAHENPVLNPLYAIFAAGDFPTVVPVLFEGSYVQSDALPRRYLVQMLAIKTPTAAFLLAAIGGAWGLARALGRPRRGSTAVFLAAAWLLAPIVAWTLTTPNIYDGIRHFLFVLPALALWAGLGVAAIVERVPRSRPSLGPIPLRAVGAAPLLLLLALPTLDLVRLHPYEMTYYNRWVGGVGGASDRYDTDYWVTSYREAADWVSARTEERSEPIRVLVAANELSAEAARHFLPADAEVETTTRRWDAQELPPEFDFYLSTTRLHLADNFPEAPVVFEVGRDGAVFAVVRGRSGTDPQTADPADHQPEPDPEPRQPSENRP